MMRTNWQTLFQALAALAACTTLHGREIHVAKTGDDATTGDAGHPFLTIGKAASVAQAGDTITVRAGTYREWVKPPRGGESEDRRITYQAAAGEQVFIKGSERIDTWQRVTGAVWKATLPNSFFGDYNPYALTVSGGWLNYGQWHHRGDVYLNGEALREKQTLAELAGSDLGWHCRVDGSTTTIHANFAQADPNTELVEINVRECLFMPEITGLQYLTIRGFHFAHAAANWAPPVIELQTGAVGPRMGKRWIIERCTISNARCVGIILGQAPGVDYSDIEAYGDHVVRHNLIRRCGQAGIAGQKGATRSLIEHNLIEQTNYRREFGGWETAAIKFHNSVDTVIRANLIRGVYHQTQGAFGIWIDFGNQGVRISGNIIYDTQAATVFLEMNHGPSLVDNNILIGQPCRANSEASVFAHNLFVDCGYEYHPDTHRQSAYFKPHTTIPAGRKTGTAQDDRWYHNIFVRTGLDRVKNAPGYASDYNVFLAGAARSSFGDAHSLVDPFPADVTVDDRPDGATVRFTVNEQAVELEGPWVNADLVGVFATTGQTIEDRAGRPLTVDTDLPGSRRPRPIAGPLAQLHPGTNAVVWRLVR